jgi:hypothetical protein
MCGHGGIADDACFCPSCRHQFRQPEPDVTFDQYPQVVPPYAHDPAPGPEPAVPGTGHILDALLLQPAVLVMIFVAAVTYLTIGSLSQFSVTLAGAEFRLAGVVSLGIGVIVAWIFYRFMLVRME